MHSRPARENRHAKTKPNKYQSSSLVGNLCDLHRRELRGFYKAQKNDTGASSACAFNWE